MTKIDSTLVDALFPYQREGVLFGIQKAGRVLIADEMGLGKTVQALGIARYYKAEWPLLVICPSSVKFAWKAQILKFLPAISEGEISVIDKTSDPLPVVTSSNTVVIVSYAQATNRLQKLKEKAYRVIIFDESHSIKDNKAQRTKMSQAISAKATRVMLLSGTPALSRPAELFNHLRALDSKLFPNFRDFAIRYCDGRQGPFAFEAKGATNTEELVVIMEKTHMIRRLKKDVLDQLPPKRREKIELSGDAVGARLAQLQKAKAACLSSADRGAEKQTMLLAYYAETGMAKAAAVAEYVCNEFFQSDGDDEVERPKKVLIFAHHQPVLDTLCNRIAQKRVRYVRIDGRTPAKKRDELVQQFQTDQLVRAAVLSVTAVGVGVTLTAASVVVFAELHWNPGTLFQAEDRAHRVGQNDFVQVQYLVAKDTADDFLWPMIQRKMDVLTSISLNSDSFRGAGRRSVKTADLPIPETPPDVQRKLTEFFHQLQREEEEAATSLTVDGNEDAKSDSAEGGTGGGFDPEDEDVHLESDFNFERDDNSVTNSRPPVSKRGKYRT